MIRSIIKESVESSLHLLLRDPSHKETNQIFDHQQYYLTNRNVELRTITDSKHAVNLVKFEVHYEQGAVARIWRHVGVHECRFQSLRVGGKIGGQHREHLRLLKHQRL